MANRIKGITVEIGGDTTGLDKALKSVNSSITKTQSALNDVNRLLKLDPSNTVLVAQKQELLAQAVSQTEEKLSALEAAQEQVAAAFARGDIGADKYQAFQREIEETRGKLNKYQADLSDLQTEQDALSQNTARLEKLFAATGTEVDDYADVLGSRLTSAIKNGTASSDQLRTALEKIGKSATGGKADIRKLTDALDTVDDGQAIQNLIQQLREAGDAAENTADDVGQIAENTKGAALMQAADQLSAVGDKIQEIGDKALDAYTDTENAVTKVNAYFGETVSSVLLAISGVISSIMGAIQNVISSIWNAISSKVSAVVNAIKNTVTSVFNAIKSVASTVWNGIKSVISTVVDGIKSKVSSVFNAVKNTVSNVFNGIKNTATTVWNGIKNAITAPIEAAKNTVKGIVDKISGFFSGIKLELPKIKLPHFRITGKLSLVPPSVPHLSIDWYKEGGIMTKPTVFGMNGSSLMAGGEAGREAILPLKGFYSQLSAMLDQRLDMSGMEKYLAIIAENSGKGIYLDDGTLVGRILPAVDAGLAAYSIRGERGNR